MGQPTVPELLARLARHFDRQGLDREKIQAYKDELADVPTSILDQAVTELIRGKTDPWFPTVGEIRAACAENVLDLPSETAALEQINARIVWGRADHSTRGSAPPVHPVVRRALQQVGGFPAFRNSDEPTVIRGQFARLYKDLRASAVREVQLAPALERGHKMLELNQ